MKIKNKWKGVNANSQDDASKLESFNSEASKYKKIVKKKKREYFKNVNKKMKVLRSNNSEEYWKILNKDESAKDANVYQKSHLKCLLIISRN